jgi:5'-nucleotidase
MNPFGIRADLVPAADGTVTFSDIYKTQPFNNTLVTMTLSGAQLKALLEQQFDAEGPEQVLAVSQGFGFTYDKRRPVGDRVVQMTLDGRPIDAAASYRVTASNFLQAGGDFFTVFTQGSDPVIGTSDIEAFEAWIKDGRTVPVEERAVERTG